jgi:hypothetical protein
MFIILSWLVIIFIILDYSPNLDTESEQQCETDQDDQVGREENHYKGKWIINRVGGNEHLDSEEREKNGCQDKHNLSYPPKNIRHGHAPQAWSLGSVIFTA